MTRVLAPLATTAERERASRAETAGAATVAAAVSRAAVVRAAALPMEAGRAVATVESHPPAVAVVRAAATAVFHPRAVAAVRVVAVEASPRPAAAEVAAPIRVSAVRRTASRSKRTARARMHNTNRRRSAWPNVRHGQLAVRRIRPEPRWAVTSITPALHRQIPPFTVPTLVRPAVESVSSVACVESQTRARA